MKPELGSSMQQCTVALPVCYNFLIRKLSFFSPQPLQVQVIVLQRVLNFTYKAAWSNISCPHAVDGRPYAGTFIEIVYRTGAPGAHGKHQDWVRVILG